MQPSVKRAISYLAVPQGNITYHDIIAFNQELSVKGPRNFKRLCNFSGGNLDLRIKKEHAQHIKDITRHY